MASRSAIERSELLGLARSLTPLQRQIVLALRDRGPGLLLEVAVRVLKFPEEVSQPVADLRAKRVVEFSRVSGGAFGGDMIMLTSTGEQLASSLRDESFVQQLEQPASTQTVNLQEEEVAILRRLGDLAEMKGDLSKASEYYTKALEVNRSLSAAAGMS